MSPITLLDCTIDRTADQVLDRLSADAYRGANVQIWLYEDQAKRQAIEAELRKSNIAARVHSAYKPLIHFFLEDVDASSLTAVDIIYPQHDACTPERFLQEAYPLAGLLPQAAITFTPAAASTSDASYHVTLYFGDRIEHHRIFAPNVLSQDFLGNTVYAPTAWIRVQQHGATTDVPLATDYLHCHEKIMTAITAHDWGLNEPYFDRLIITLNLPGIERSLFYGNEVMSTTEAMHEDLYFSLIEYFQHHSGRTPGSRSLRPGQIIPDIRLDNNHPIHIKIIVEPATPLPHIDSPAIPEQTRHTRVRAASFRQTNLAAINVPLPLEMAHRILHDFQGRHFAFASRQERTVNGVHIKGNHPGVVISGAQHANETSGVVGVLRAGQQLQTLPDAHFVLIPVENPDGYALHQQLCVHNPHHMHHAARYSALGDDIEYREHAPWLELHARHHAFTISDAELHLNLHGYPAHEWTRPCTGYLPRGFESWSIPQGFFLILRYKTAWHDRAMLLLDHVTQDLATNTQLLDFNARQMACYLHHGGKPSFSIKNGIPFLPMQFDDQQPGVTLITEFPDQTIYDDDFVFAHSVQTQTVIAACKGWWTAGAHHQQS